MSGHRNRKEQCFTRKEESGLTLLNANERPHKMISLKHEISVILSEKSFDGVIRAENSGVCRGGKSEVKSPQLNIQA